MRRTLRSTMSPSRPARLQHAGLLRVLGIVPAVAALGLMGCEPDEDKAEDTATSTCDAPVAMAGADLSISVGEPAVLDGSESTFCAEHGVATRTFGWTFETIPTDSSIDVSALSDNRSATAVTPNFVPDVPGDYTLALTVSDPAGDSAPDYVVVRVGVGDDVPVADCGANLSGELGETFTFDASASADPEGARLEYHWALSNKPTCSDLDTSNIYNSGGPSPTLVPDCDGVYSVSLVVSDGIQYSEPAICYAEVRNDDRAPIADAGENYEFGVCADNPFQLNGWGSYDPDGDALTYQWSIARTPADSTVDEGAFDDRTSPEPQFTWDVPGTYIFQLEVHDGYEWSPPDLVVFTVDGDAENNTPVANAGEDVSIEKEVDCESTSYVWTCPDCSGTDIELDGSASFDPDGDAVSYTWSESTGSVGFGNRYSAITDLYLPAQPGAYGVTNTVVYEVDLEVADCEASASDTKEVTFTCTGQRP